MHRLRPGQSRRTTVTVRAPKSAAGHYDLAAVYASQVVGHGSLNVSGAAGARVLLSYPGHAPVKPCEIPSSRAAAAPTHGTSGGGSAVAELIFTLVAFLVLGIAARWLWRHRPHAGGNGSHVRR